MPGLISHPPPPHVVGPATKRATRPSKKLPQSLVEGAKLTKKEPWDSEKHLAFQPPSKILSMKEIGLEGHGISPNACSEPFPLFSEEAIKQMRAEIFSETVLGKCQYASTFNANMVRGMGHELAPFTYDAWHSPETLAKISQVAGVEVIPAFDFDIANINISVSDDKNAEISIGENKLRDGADNDNLSSVAWHYDSFPFVCVVMMSDCTGMVGGETAVRKPNGEVIKVRGPSTGRYIEHQALKALGGRERITMVTALRPKSPFIRDESVLTGVRGISNLDELYHQYTEYRLEILEERLRAKSKEERKLALAKKKYDIPAMRHFLEEQRAFIDSMLTEIVEVEDD
ncbi:uncharacterized protein NECHADRAFT_87606 [Fusarium vanettenii 77-13-4]|uniref:Fe2OG dioxygenase domain-containing protein n=1 Tax=Fusarium vanettenii (strain ATCC MYA-4622 / CBS 123669 / FGSC 9596 / NRRL 45880 / 77-13-4) TaxID=660122 RepID=C7Z2H8_FUSV7|nr:uncharacterized protein NECHADRAFT_87606 [Fusarium vanettenii 77-13-4]EEU41663.1 hypothetical protein NECHADRAFT_87606 [Fusarium vanettenii 77-13-4]